MTKALIVVDVQNDFCEGGSLAVAGGNQVARDVYNYIMEEQGKYAEIVFTRDRHLPLPNDNGGHFAVPPAEPDYSNTWPVHCVIGTRGAEIHPDLKLTSELIGTTFDKGTGRPDYSGFQGRAVVGGTLANFLNTRGIDTLDVVGIAGDYCVRATALDGVAEGFKVNVLTEMVASVGGPEATQAALVEVLGAQGRG